MITIYVINFINYMKKEGVEVFTLEELGEHIKIFNKMEIEKIIMSLNVKSIIEKYTDCIVFKAGNGGIYELGVL